MLVLTHRTLNKKALLENKFSGEGDIHEFLRNFEILVVVNEWSDKKAGQYMAVFCQGNLSSTCRDGEKEL